MLFHHLGTADRYGNIPMFFHEYPSYGTFASASQVQLDVDYDDLVDTINVFSKIEPIKAVLFSNAVLLGEHEELLCARDLFWENSTHGINPHNVGMFDCELEDIDDLQSYIESTSMYCVERDDKYINFRPVNVMEYFDSPVIKGEYFDGTKYQDINVVPRLSDIKYLRTFKFEDLTFRGTIEFRSCCCQPISDAMTVAAFHLGLKERLKELQELMEQDHVIYHHGYSASELRKMFNMRKYPDFIDETKLYELCRQVIDIAAAGLKDRGFGEEEYLTPLYERINKRSNPAKWLLSSMENGVSLEDMIVQYSNRDFCTI
jgi:gamma-glutamylcysteine synthetase